MTSPGAFLSSPTRAPRRAPYHVVSSSPDLPPLQDIVTQKPKKPLLKSGSRAAAIPADALTSFTSAGKLWRSRTIDDLRENRETQSTPPVEVIEDDGIVPPVAKVPIRKISKQRKPKRRTGDTENDGDVLTLSRSVESPSKSQPWKKFKSRLSPEERTVTKPENCPVTPTRAVLLQPAEDVIEDTNRHFPINPERNIVSVPKEDASNEPLQLEQAMPRRVDWTPPSHKSPVVLDSDSPGAQEQGRAVGDEPVESFQDILGTFKYVDEPVKNTAFPDGTSVGVAKRQVTDFLVNKKGGEPDLVPVSEKSTNKRAAPKKKKKARTITDLATRGYRPATQPEPMPSPAIFNAKPIATSSKQRKRTTKAPKKQQTPKPVLLSPSAALNHVAKQDFLFGTSSQLATEQSPTFLRDLHAAMKISNEMDYVDCTTPINSDAIEPPEQRKRLWDAAARDEDGTLLDLEIIDIVDKPPELPPLQQDMNPFGYTGAECQRDPKLSAGNDAYKNSAEDESFMNLSDILPPSGQHPAEVSDDYLSLPGSQTLVSSTKGQLGSQMREGGNNVAFVPEPNENLGTTMHDCADSEMTERPLYEAYTDAQLSREIKSYGFKAIKKRTAMIALLDQCWESKSGVSLTSTRTASTLSKTSSNSQATAAGTKSAETSAAGRKRTATKARKPAKGLSDIQEPPPSAQPAPSPKKGRGRPKKAAPPNPSTSKNAAGKTKVAEPRPSTPKRKRKAPTVVEIPDSASDAGSRGTSEAISPSPEPTFSPPQIDLSLTMEEDTDLSLTMSPAGQEEIHAYITKAITTAPRTTDPAHPSWHEKILLYDPIVLEDLAGWLNSGELTRVGYDGEVSGGELKKWCESRSVCCVWKVNLRGKERKRY